MDTCGPATARTASVRRSVKSPSLSRQARAPAARTAAHDAGPLDTAISRLVASGATNTQIAQELGISTHTVRAHLSHILHVLKLENRTQLAVYIKAQQS